MSEYATAIVTLSTLSNATVSQKKHIQHCWAMCSLSCALALFLQVLLFALQYASCGFCGTVAVWSNARVVPVCCRLSVKMAQNNFDMLWRSFWAQWQAKMSRTYTLNDGDTHSQSFLAAHNTELNVIIRTFSPSENLSQLLLFTFMRQHARCSHKHQYPSHQRKSTCYFNTQFVCHRNDILNILIDARATQLGSTPTLTVPLRRRRASTK